MKKSVEMESLIEKLKTLSLISKNFATRKESRDLIEVLENKKNEESVPENEGCSFSQIILAIVLVNFAMLLISRVHKVLTSLVSKWKKRRLEVKPDTENATDTTKPQEIETGKNTATENGARHAEIEAEKKIPEDSAKTEKLDKNFFKYYTK